MRISDWSSDVCSSDLRIGAAFADILHDALDDVIAAREDQRLELVQLGASLGGAQCAVPDETGLRGPKSSRGITELCGGSGSGHADGPRSGSHHGAVAPPCGPDRFVLKRQRLNFSS